MCRVHLRISRWHFVCSVHLRVEEKMSLTASREGGLQNLEVHGIVTLKITSDKFGRIKVAVRNSDTKGIQLQVIALALFR